MDKHEHAEYDKVQVDQRLWQALAIARGSRRHGTPARASQRKPW